LYTTQQGLEQADSQRSKRYNAPVSWIAKEIESRGGAVTFREFMELALYHPDHGYYTSETARYGRCGDFLTAPSASRWYGRVVAGLLAGVAIRLGPLTLVDVGSGDGSFVTRLVAALGPSAKQVLREVVSVESSAQMRLRQQTSFESLSVRARCAERMPDVSGRGFTVVIHASELYDALPVHRVVARDDRLFEQWVCSRGDEVRWLEKPAPSTLGEYFTQHGVKLEQGQVAEVNFGARSLHAELLQNAGDSALALILDYGYPASRLYDPRGRRGGSIACYREHLLRRDPLECPGKQDITSHVNWDDLQAVGRGVGWRDAGLWSLAEFLIRSGIGSAMEKAGIGPEADLDASVVAERQEIKRLLDPDGMGSDLKMLVQATPNVAGAVEGLLQVRK
jgi:SAM-dependent MidA family methyltransferase